MKTMIGDRIRRFSVMCGVGLSLAACTAQEHRHDVREGECPANFSLAKANSFIKKGMSQNQVVTYLGSPNIITTDKQGHESWVYDKVSTEGASSASGGGGSLILFGSSKSAAAYEVTQKTLTVIVRFDGQKQVHSLDYHQSKF